MKNMAVIVSLGVICFLLVLALSVVSWLLMVEKKKRKSDAKNKCVKYDEPIVINLQTPVATPQITTTTIQRNDELPTYPRRNPSYPTRNTINEFQQLGILTSKDSPPMVLPLFGKLMATRKDRWEYYTTTSGEHMLRIPVMFEDKDCMSGDVGCREVYNNDTVYLPTYQKEFTVQLYKYKL